MSHKTKITRILYIFHRIYKKILRLRTLGVRLIVFNTKGQVLLVKHSYRPNYFFPGGGVEKGEEILDAAKRELWEETNLRAKNFEIKGIYRFFLDDHDDTVITFKVTNLEDESALKIDNSEIIDAKWFDVDKLPEDISVGTGLRLQDILNSEAVNVKNWALA